MEDASKYTFHDFLERGELGDTEVELRLSVRQVAALQFIMAVATQEFAVGLLAVRTLAERGNVDEARLLELEFDRAQARIGVAMADRLDEPEFATTAAMRLAALDQKATELRNEAGA